MDDTEAIHYLYFVAQTAHKYYWGYQHNLPWDFSFMLTSCASEDRKLRRGATILPPSENSVEEELREENRPSHLQHRNQNYIQCFAYEQKKSPIIFWRYTVFSNTTLLQIWWAFCWLCNEVNRLYEGGLKSFRPQHEDSSTRK